MALAAEALLKLRAVFDGQGFDQARRALGGIEKTADNARSSFKNVIDSSVWQGAAVAATGIGAGLIYSAKKAMELETQMVQVRKVVEFDSPNGLKQLTQDLVNLSTQIPYSAKELGELAAAAGQAGYAEKDILKFVKAAATMGTAFNMSAKDAGDAMIAFQAAMGLPLDDAIKLGDAINHLSDNMEGVVEPESLVEVTKRIGAIGVASGLSAKEVAALGAAFLAPGTKAEVAATGLKNFLKALTQGESGSKSFRKAMDQLMGMPNAAQWVAKNMQIDPKGTIMKVIDQLRKVPKELQAGLISDIFGEESKAAIQPLLTNTKLLAQAFGLVADESKFAGSMTNEFNNQLNSTDAQLKVFKNNIDALAIGLGQALLPGVNAIIKSLLPFVRGLADATQKVPGLSAVIVGLGIAFAGLVISAPFIASLLTLVTALRGLSIAASVSGWLGALMPALRGLSAGGAGTGLFSGLLAGARALPGLVMRALSGLPGMLAGLFRGLGGALGLGNVAQGLRTFFDTLRGFTPTMVMKGGQWVVPWTVRLATALRGILPVMALVGRAIAGVFSGPVGWVALLITAGVALYAFRDKITAFIAQVAPKLAKLFEPLRNFALGQPKQGQTSQPQQQGILNPMDSILAAFNPVVLGARIGQALNQAFTMLAPTLQLLGQQLGSAIQTALSGIGTFFNTFVVIPLQQLWNTLGIWLTQTIQAWSLAWWNYLVTGFNIYVVTPIQMAWQFLATGIQTIWNGLVLWFTQSIANFQILFSGIWNQVAVGFNAYVQVPLQTGWNAVVLFFQNGLASIREWFINAWNGLSNAFNTNVVLPIQQMWNTFITWLQNTVANIRFFLGSMWNGLALGFNTYIVQPITMAWTTLLGFIRNSWGGMVINLQNAANSIAVVFSQAFNNVASRIKSVFEGIINWVSNAINNLRGLVNGVIARYNRAAARVGAPRIQQFAKGGYVSGPTLAWVGEGRDSEYIIPSAKMAAASMAYLAGARGASVLSGGNSIRGFARGGYVKGRRGKKQKTTKTKTSSSETDFNSANITIDTPYEAAFSMTKESRNNFTTTSNRKGKSIMLPPLFAGLDGKLTSKNPLALPRSGLKEPMAISKERGPERKLIVWTFAAGGYVTRPTLGLIGEGRDSEYIIPSKRMAASSMAYLAGARGMGVVNPPRFANGGLVGSTTNRTANLNNLLDRTNIGNGAVVVQPSEPTINANYQIQTGEVRQDSDGRQWVAVSDLPQILEQNNKQLLGTLRTAQGKRAIGR